MKNVAFKALTGSYNQGLNIEGSDRDYKVICIPSFEDLYMGKFINGQIHSEEVDIEYIDIRSFVHQIRKGNPNYLEILFSLEFSDVSTFDLVSFIEEHKNELLFINPMGTYHALRGMMCSNMKKDDSKSVYRFFQCSFAIENYVKALIAEDGYKSFYTEERVFRPCPEQADILKSIKSGAKINENFKQLALTDIDNLKDKLKEFETPKKSSLKAFVELEKLVKNIVFDQAIGI